MEGKHGRKRFTSNKDSLNTQDMECFSVIQEFPDTNKLRTGAPNVALCDLNHTMQQGKENKKKISALT